MNNNIFIPLPPFKGWVLQNFPFIEEDFDAITSYQLWCKVVAYLNNTNNNVNVLAREVLDIKNYFDNLDVQEEIDNKLDEMAESGELTDIIAQYLELAGILAYNTLDDLKNAENLNDGSFTKIYGKITYNDGYGAFYKVRLLINTDVIDDDNLVALVNYPTLVAEKMKDSIIGNIEDLNTTNKDDIVSAINEVNSNANDIEETIEDDILPFLNGENYQTQPDYYYIDGINGSDDNDGLSTLTPFKTIDKFLELLNTRSNDIRCHIMTSGTYTISKTKPNITSAVIHIVGDTNDIILANDGSELVFYGGHLNFNNITLDITNFYMDGVLGSFTNCYIKKYFRQYGGQLYLNGCKINSFRCFYGQCYINDITIDSKAKTNSALYFGACAMGVLEGSFTIEELEVDCADLFTAYRSYIVFSPSSFNNANSGSSFNYSRGLVSNYITLMTTNTMNNNLNGVSASNSVNHTLTVTSNATLPA